MEKPGLVLLIPAGYDLDAHKIELARSMDAAGEINLASLRLQSAGLTRDMLLRKADILRDLGHSRDIAVIIDDHAGIAQEAGLDGVHLTNADAKTLRQAKKALGADAIIGVFAGASKHDGLIAGEIGCDYVAFGPLKFRGFDEEIAQADIFLWWSQMIELPIIAEGIGDESGILAIRDYADFITLGEEIFNMDSPSDALKALLPSFG